MKKLVALLALSIASTVFAAETKEVCIDKRDKAGNLVKDKAGKVVQDCKKMKVHKKLEGTEVPGQKK